MLLAEVRIGPPPDNAALVALPPGRFPGSPEALMTNSTTDSTTQKMKNPTT
jgi:hypothetical protein